MVILLDYVTLDSQKNLLVYTFFYEIWLSLLYGIMLFCILLQAESVNWDAT